MYPSSVFPLNILILWLTVCSSDFSCWDSWLYHGYHFDVGGHLCPFWFGAIINVAVENIFVFCRAKICTPVLRVILYTCLSMPETLLSKQKSCVWGSKRARTHTCVSSYVCTCILLKRRKGCRWSTQRTRSASWRHACSSKWDINSLLAATHSSDSGRKSVSVI